jgi:broad specificity phosphatase PhoE
MVVGLAWSTTAFAQQTVIVVRHAERADGGVTAGGSSMTAAPADPALSAAGEARAAKLADMLRDAGVAAVYATEYRRTADTGRPLAKARGLDVRQMAARDTAALAARLKAEHAKDVVVVIGHSNTVPEIISALGGPTITMRDDEYDAL